MMPPIEDAAREAYTANYIAFGFRDWSADERLCRLRGARFVRIA